MARHTHQGGILLDINGGGSVRLNLRCSETIVEYVVGQIRLTGRFRRRPATHRREDHRVVHDRLGDVPESF